MRFSYFKILPVRHRNFLSVKPRPVNPTPAPIPYQRYQIVKATWPAIVSKEVFDNVQKSIAEGRILENQRLSTAETRVFLLSGIFRCGECGKALIGQSAHGKTRVHRYYGHSKIDKGNKPCDVKNLRADDVEQAVLNYLDDIVIRAGHLNRIEKNMKTHLMATTEDLRLEKELKENSLHDLEKEIDSVLKFQFSIDAKSSAVTMLTEKLEKFKKGWKKAAPTVQKRFLRRMLDCLVYTKEGIKTFYHLDNLSKSVNQKNKMNIAEGQNPSAFSFLSINQVLRKLVLTSNQLIKSSSAFANGGL